MTRTPRPPVSPGSEPAAMLCVLVAGGAVGAVHLVGSLTLKQVLLGGLAGAFLLGLGALLLLAYNVSTPGPLALEARPRVGHERCSYCHDSGGDLDARCPTCGTGLHGSCWGEHGGCPTLGCRRGPRQAA